MLSPLFLNKLQYYTVSTKSLQKSAKIAHLLGALYVALCRKKIYTLNIMNKATFLTEEHKILLSDPNHRLTAERLVIKCGVRADLDGYDCLMDAVILYGTESCTRFCQIYRILGEKYHMGYKSVMKLISYAIEQAFDLPERLSQMTGVTIRKIDIHNSLVIAYLGKLFRSPSLNIYGSITL